MDYAFKWVIENHGIDSEDDYPYQGAEKTCLKNKVLFPCHYLTDSSLYCV